MYFIAQISCTSLTDNVTEMCYQRAAGLSALALAIVKRKDNHKQELQLVSRNLRITTHAQNYPEQSVCVIPLLRHTSRSLSQKAEATVSDHMTTRISSCCFVSLLAQAVIKC